MTADRQRVRPLLNECWFVECDEADRITRLVERHVAHGRSPDAARRWVERTDEPNARLIESTRPEPIASCASTSALNESGHPSNITQPPNVTRVGRRCTTVPRKRSSRRRRRCRPSSLSSGIGGSRSVPRTRSSSNGSVDTGGSGRAAGGTAVRPLAGSRIVGWSVTKPSMFKCPLDRSCYRQWLAHPSASCVVMNTVGRTTRCGA